MNPGLGQDSGEAELRSSWHQILNNAESGPSSNSSAVTGKSLLLRANHQAEALLSEEQSFQDHQSQGSQRLSPQALDCFQRADGCQLPDQPETHWVPILVAVIPEFWVRNIPIGAAALTLMKGKEIHDYFVSKCFSWQRDLLALQKQVKIWFHPAVPKFWEWG